MVWFLFSTFQSPPVFVLCISLDCWFYLVISNRKSCVHQLYFDDSLNWLVRSAYSSSPRNSRMFTCRRHLIGLPFATFLPTGKLMGLVIGDIFFGTFAHATFVLLPSNGNHFITALKSTLKFQRKSFQWKEKYINNYNTKSRKKYKLLRLFFNGFFSNLNKNRTSFFYMHKTLCQKKCKANHHYINK